MFSITLFILKVAATSVSVLEYESKRNIKTIRKHTHKDFVLFRYFVFNTHIDNRQECILSSDEKNSKRTSQRLSSRQRNNAAASYVDDTKGTHRINKAFEFGFLTGNLNHH